MIIYLLRHGESESHGKKCYIGHTNTFLTKRGHAQAQKWHDYFKDTPPDLIVTSDLNRTHKTAQIISGKGSIPIQVEKDFREINLGTWEGFSHSDIKKQFPKEWEKRGRTIDRFKPPGGESFSDLQTRVLPIFERYSKIQKVKYQLLIVHAGVIRVILCNIFGIPLNQLFQIEISYGGLTALSSDFDCYHLLFMNQTIDNSTMYQTGIIGSR